MTIFSRKTVSSSQIIDLDVFVPFLPFSLYPGTSYKGFLPVGESLLYFNVLYIIKFILLYAASEKYKYISIIYLLVTKPLVSALFFFDKNYQKFECFEDSTLEKIYKMRFSKIAQNYNSTFVLISISWDCSVFLGGLIFFRF